MTVGLARIVAELDALLDVASVPDYPNALNGLQFAHRGPVRKVATAVDASHRTISGAIGADANLLVVHHGLFWSGVTPITHHHYERIRLLVEHDVAVYSAHLPLDAHATIGNSRLLADRLGLTVRDGFATVRGVTCGVQGDADMPTSDLLEQARAFAAVHGGWATATAMDAERRTRRWGICSGASVDPATLAEARTAGIDTLIVGEGPHWSAVEAPERDLVIIYAGHYATEALGVMALGDHLGRTFGIPHDFIAAPTGL
ncbi:MAG TPA: Nif3-like dinuclear metal center hexameric protein [Gemmatimonadaceae bacterium]|nr:Nif3-like dinuclear metal center hexameric protein [Gemmatimonadaceae bacterium]